MSIEIARAYLKERGYEDRIMEFDVSSATVELAAKAVGVEPARICKTLSFKLKDGTGILVQVAGDARVDNKKYKDFFGEKAKMLSPEEVPEYTNHEIGGVCAFGVTRDDVKIYCDVTMKRFETVFPACGSSNSAVRFTPDELFEVSGAIDWIDVVKLPE
ncbi:MAG: YbaK/EbsC family protein [Mogibacterium sp.]|nr:YbaK/EbsC family protein [Mogibacterium sp.]MBR2540906.1 YbaK/EbsC family protein [Mogibacterium sp.]